jgi:DNA-binding LacI/PurR family transcriptional regulator
MPQVTMKEIAEKVGLSRQTISEILNHKKTMASAATREKVLKCAQELNYTPNYFARSLKNGKTNMIGVATVGDRLADFARLYSANIYEGIGSFFSRYDYKIVFYHYQKVLQNNRYLDLIRSRAVDGLILLLLSRDVEDLEKNHELENIRRTDVPFVVIHSLMYDLQCPIVGLNCIKGGILSAEHFISHDYDSIGIVMTNSSILHHEDLLTGLRQGLTDTGRSLLPEFIFHAGISGDQEAGYALAEKLLAEKKRLPRALLVVEELMAYGMIKKFRESGIRVPEDVAVIGFGDLDLGSNYMTDLTCLKQPAQEKGFKAGELLLNLVEHPEENNGPRVIVLEPSLTIRKSCGC